MILRAISPLTPGIERLLKNSRESSIVILTISGREKLFIKTLLASKFSLVPSHSSQNVLVMNLA